MAAEGVHVTVLVPGATDTPMLTRFGADRSPMRRLIMPVEECVSDGLAALAENRSQRVTGAMNRLTVAATSRRARTRVFGSMHASMAAGRQAEQARKSATG